MSLGPGKLKVVNTEEIYGSPFFKVRIRFYHYDRSLKHFPATTDLPSFVHNISVSWSRATMVLDSGYIAKLQNLPMTLSGWSRVGLRTATVFTVYGHRNTAAVTVPWPNLSSQSQFGVGTVDRHMCRRYAAAYGRIRPCSYSEIDARDPEIAIWSLVSETL